MQGSSEITMRHNSQCVHRYTKARGSEQHAAISIDTSQDHDDDARKSFSQSPWQRILTRKPQKTVERMFLISLCSLLLMKWTDSPSGGMLLLQEFRPHPLMVQTFTLSDVTRLLIETNPTHFIHNRENMYWINHGTSEYKPASTLPEGCEAQDWMTDLHPSCLDIHQVDMTDFFFTPQRTSVTIHGEEKRDKFRFIGRGGFRFAFLFHQEEQGFVIKTLKYHEDKDFNHRNFDYMRRDAVISEQLTSSPYIANMYGYCGHSVLVDYSPGKDMDWLFEDGPKPTKDELFQIANDVAHSVAAAAHYDKTTGRATIVHMDLKPDQWIPLNGRYVLNDFNLARFITWDPIAKEYCGVADGFSGGRYQAPEQLIEDAEEDSPRTDKIDVFALGNVLGFLLTEEWPFPELSGDAVEEVLSKGAIWNITDPKILDSTHPFDVSVLKAREMCLQFDYRKRPQAQQVADFLRQALDEYNESKLKLGER